ncbi:MAG TPA: hypothetical protein VMT15_18495 [Bryobacteraceae bacterium]|nr:hypothetical protein [Bryobacteraceae bacterium]
MNLSGNVTGGYTADFGNSTASDHGFTAAANGTLAGSYYDPNFFNFTVQPFYNESWANSDSQSVLNTSGVTTNASIFAGSNFPGSISYSKVLNSTGNFGVPGVANYTSHGDADTFSLGWSEHVEHFPTVSAGYQQGSSTYSIFGASSNISSNFHGVNVYVNEMIAGFTLTAGYHFLDNHIDLPDVLGTQAAETSSSKTNSYSFGVGHNLPFHGSLSGSVNRSEFTSNYTSGHYSGTLDTISAGLSFNPIERLNVGVNAQYNDNLLGSIYQPILAANGVLPATVPTDSTHALDIIGYANYRIERWHLAINATDDHRNERVLGLSLTSNVFTGTVTYSNEFLGGFLNVTGGATRATVSPSDETRLGLLGSVNYTRHTGRWDMTASGNYTQNAETLLATYTTNSYGYSGNLSRKFGRTSHWAVIASGTKTTLVGSQGAGTLSQSYSTALSMRKFSLSAAYTRSNGNGVLTATGVASTSVLLPVLSSTAIILYGGTAYSGAVGMTPIRGLTLSATYSKAFSNTQGNSVNSYNTSEQLNARVQYLIRKIYFQAGYLRLKQSFSQSGTPPATVESLYVSLARWFTFF